ncbi:MAG: lysophospholipid acyltransferase family protein [Sporichthyaceae bacterium]
MFYRLLKYVLIGPWLRLLFRPQVQGLEHIARRGPVLLASNHLSFSDSFFLPLVVPRRITFLAKAEYFTGKGIKGRLIAAFFRGVGQIPLDRSGGSAAEAAMRAGLEVLAAGEVFCIYPEGTRSPDGRLYRGHTGVARLAAAAGVPVLPVAMIGTRRIQPPGRLRPTIARVGVRVGAPIELDRRPASGEDQEVMRARTDALMEALRKLSGQEYVDAYARDAKLPSRRPRRPSRGLSGGRPKGWSL